MVTLHDIYDKPEEHEHKMGYSAPASCYNLEPCVSIGCIEFKLCGELRLTSIKEAHMKHEWNVPERREALGLLHPRRTTTDPRYHICMRQH